MNDNSMLRVLLRRYLQQTPKLFAVHVNPGGASFLKHYDYFEAQGGNIQEWGKHWTIVLAFDEPAVRLFAIQHLGARKDALFCCQCGKESHGKCAALPPPEALEVPREVALEEWNRARSVT